MARIAILTASTKGAAGEREDTSGDIAESRAREAGHEVVARAILPDDEVQLAARLREWADTGVADVVITTGGTGLTARDVTPEATLTVAERHVPGIPLALIVEGMKHTPMAPLTRGVAVTRGSTLIVNLPGNPKGVEQGMDVLVPLLSHIAQLLAGPVEH